MQEKTDTTDAHEIGLLDVFNFLAKHKKVILGVALIAGLLTSVVTMLMPNIYTANLKIIPPPQTQLVQSALESEGFRGILIQRFNLTQAYKVKSINDARCQLKGLTRIKPDKDGTILVEVDDVEPERATALANAYPEELDKFIISHELNDAIKQRKKIELRIKILQEQLASANKELDAAGKTAHINALAAEKEKDANIASLRAQLDFILDSDSSNMKIIPSLDRLREQLERLLQANPNKPVKNISSADQHYLEHFSQVKYLESSIDSLKRRHTLLMLDEQMNNTRILDPATVPQGKSKPKRLQIVASAMLGAVFLAILLLLLKEWIATIRKQARQAAPEL